MSGNKFSKCLECGFSGECNGCENREIEDPNAEYVLLIQWDTCYKTGCEFLHVDLWDLAELQYAEGGPNSGSSTGINPTAEELAERVKAQVQQELHRVSLEQIVQVWVPMGFADEMVKAIGVSAEYDSLWLEDVPVHARFGTLVYRSDEWFTMVDAHIDAEGDVHPLW